MSVQLLIQQLEEAKLALEEKGQELSVLEKTILKQKEKILAQETRINWLTRMLFGTKSDRVVESPSSSVDVDMFVELGERGEATPDEIKEELKEPKKERAHGKGRKPIPAELPRKEVVIDIEEDKKVCPCCGEEMGCIGHDETEKIEAIPAHLYVTKYRRPRYACGKCEGGVIQAPLPNFPIQRASAGVSLLVYILLCKYADHIPLCRMETIMKRHGIDLSRNKTTEWMMLLSDLIAPLVMLMLQWILERSVVIGADETRVQRQDPGKGKTKRCWFWQYRGDDNAPFTYFDYRDNRSSAGPEEILTGYTGYLQSDDYAVYTSLLKVNGIDYTMIGCMAHARRKFVDAYKGGQKRAKRAVELFKQIYKVEEEGKKKLASEEAFDADSLKELRQEQSLPLLKELKEWMQSCLDVPPGNPLAKAISYTLNNWDKLLVYTTDGRLSIDNNAVERSMRPIAIGRKNWMFAGSDRGGKAAARFYTLIESAKRADVNLWDYLNDLLTRLPSHPINRLEELLPNRWRELRTQPPPS